MGQCVIPEIRYHAVMGRIPRNYVQQIVNRPDARDTIALLQCDDVMHIRPVGQCAVDISEDTVNDGESTQASTEDQPLGLPVVALLDGLPLAGHQAIRNRLTIDDPDSYESDYLAHERVHGTAMTSLICLGDMNGQGSPISRLVYSRPILKPRRGFDGRFMEAIPADVLPVDLLFRCIKRIYEGENGEPPAAPSVRAVNLSVCDPRRPMMRSVSPWARLLDWLSNRYNVLFLVSAGNQPNSLALNISSPALHLLPPEQLEMEVIQALAEDTRNRRIFSPAETLNGVTVGAIHNDDSHVPQSHMINPFVHHGLPSTISGHGPGFRRSIKPDVLFPGGRQLLSESLGTTQGNVVMDVPLSYASLVSWLPLQEHKERLTINGTCEARVMLQLLLPELYMICSK